MYAPCSELPVKRILDVDDVVSPDVFLAMHDNAGPSHVASTRDHDDISGVEFDEINDFALLKVILYGVVDFDHRVRVANRTAVVGDDMWDALCANGDSTDLEEFVGRLFWGDAVDCEAALDVVKKTKVFRRFFDANDICEDECERLLLHMHVYTTIDRPMKPAG